MAAHGRQVLLTGLFLAGAAVTWSTRAGAPAPAKVVALPAPAPVLATPIPEARRLSDRTLDVPGVSEIWEAPPLPPRPSFHPGGSAALPAVNGLPRTPADEVDRWVLRLATDRRADVQVALRRMAAYEPLIHHALRERGLPRDLLYLALIESEFLPSATSPAGAVGIWQFMPETARAYGLEISDYVDERRDPIRATDAAVRHLQWLYRQFGSWHLALAAYNAGGGRVGGLLRGRATAGRGDETLYWRLRPLLPDETQQYVPKLLAASRIARAPERYGLTPPHRPQPLRFRELSVPGGVPLAEVAAAVGAAPEAVYALNPHLVRRTTPPGRRWPVRIPVTLPLDGSLARSGP